MKSSPSARKRAWLCGLAGWCLAWGNLQAQNVEFAQTSDPAGVVNQTTYPLLGASVATVSAPETSGGYRFTHWTINGLRAADPSGGAANPAAFTISGATAAVASYLLEGQDTDADGLPDWWELRYHGSLGFAANSDPDGDGFDEAAEWFYNLHPGLHNEWAQGGVSRRRGEAFNVEVGVGDPTWYYGGVSRRRGPTQTVVLNTAAYAILTETSSPAGVIAQTRVIAKGTTVPLTTPPDPYATYRFTGWLLDGATRYDAPTQNQPIPFTVTADALMVARYVEQSLDSDADGILDWQEWFYFNSLQYDQNSDPDGDALTYALELLRGYSQVAADTLEQGGVSRRRGEAQTVDFTGRLPWRQASDPASILDQTEYVPPGTLVTVPDKNGHGYAGYQFSWWDLNGVRLEDASGVARTGFSFTIINASLTTAHYYDPNADTDGDGIKDWHEWTYYGNLDNGLISDTDGDGFSYEAELLRGYSPRVADTMEAGGVSRRRGELTAVNAVFLPNPPAIGVNAAIMITATTARLNALVNPIGSETTLHFAWGLTQSYDQQTDSQSAGSGLSAVTAFADLTGLLPDTTYHFRAMAANAQGTTQGEDFSFRTLKFTYASWAATLGIGHESADDDADGIFNLAEFAFGLNPKLPSQLPIAELIGGRLRLSVTEPHGLSGILYGGEWTEDLHTWNPMTDSGNGTYHEFLTPSALIGSQRVFVRWVIRSP